MEKLIISKRKELIKKGLDIYSEYFNKSDYYMTDKLFVKKVINNFSSIYNMFDFGLPYSKVSNFYNGQAIVYNKNLFGLITCGVIDITGKKIIPIIYNKITGLEKKYYICESSSYTHKIKHLLNCDDEKDGEVFSVYDRKGFKYIKNKSYIEQVGDTEVFILSKNDKKYTYNVITKCKSNYYNHINHYIKLNTFIEVSNDWYHNNHGLINKNGLEVIEPIYNAIICFKENISCYGCGGKYLMKEFSFKDNSLTLINDYTDNPKEIKK